MKILKYIKIFLIRRKKRKPFNFLRRWDKLQMKIWYRFNNMEANEKSFKWFQKNHQRLMRLKLK